MAGVELGPQPGAAADAAAPRAPTTTLPASALEGLGGEGGANIERVEMKIINGAVASAGEFDFMVALFANSKFFCGGVLLDNATVLTGGLFLWVLLRGLLRAAGVRGLAGPGAHGPSSPAPPLPSRRPHTIKPPCSAAAHCLVDTAIISNPGLLRVWVLGTQYPVERVFAHPGECFGVSGCFLVGSLAALGWAGPLPRRPPPARPAARSPRPAPRPCAPPSPAPPSPTVAPLSFHPPAGYSASKIPEDNQDLTFDGSLHDLGAVRLAAPLPSPATVALAPRDAGVQEGQLLQVAGWGMTESGSPSNVLK